MVLNRIQTVKINWSKPIALDNRFNSANFDEQEGLYLISTQYIRNGRLFNRYIYVGETINKFHNRFLQHLNNNKRSRWAKLPGLKFVRFGKIMNKPSFINDDKWFTLTLESAVIQDIKNRPNVRLVNRHQVKKYTIYYDIEIVNEGCRGPISSVINTRELYNTIDYYDKDNIIGLRKDD